VVIREARRGSEGGFSVPSGRRPRHDRAVTAA
jgi:hypothetical protein